jgi:hypothetical protein
LGGHVCTLRRHEVLQHLPLDELFPRPPASLLEDRQYLAPIAQGSASKSPGPRFEVLVQVIALQTAVLRRSLMDL